MVPALDTDASSCAQEAQTRDPLLHPRAQNGETANTAHDAAPTGHHPPNARLVTTRLCISHALSAWNSRVFEFGSVLFLAAIYPDTLLPVSTYALVRAAAAILFSPLLGLWIDGGDRLVVVRVSIIGQRLAVALSCVIFLVLERSSNDPLWIRHGLFTVIVLLAGVEKLCSVMNAVSVTRDWVVELTEGNEVARRNLSAQIRRIDLFCKLLGPFLLASVDQASTVVAIWTTLVMTLMSVFTEYFCIAQVYNLVPSLRLRRTETENAESEGYRTINQDEDAADDPQSRSKNGTWITSTVHRIFPWSSIALYAKHKAFLPSLSYAFLHLTVLSFSGRMIAFLLAMGYDSFYVGVARTISTVAELSATWISSRIMRRIGSVRSGSVSIAWETIWLTFSLGCYVMGGRLTLMGLVAGVVLSRIGLWGFDLAVQDIIQNDVETDNRGSFSTAEASIQNIFELLSYVSTIVFSRPDQFLWPMLITIGSVYSACLVYAMYLQQRRGC